ncbi:MAG: NAD-dependent epimerase/dehydratase family protein [Dehalococcoidales bacterium]|nr:NAD-dependent epimerase/dehydratase family protein [Dehalococcoidales bacterium]
MDDYRKEYKGKTILITGGAGCIGSNLTKALIEAEAARIVVLDDLSAAEEWNIPVAPQVDFIEGSVLDEKALDKAFSPAPDYVLHLAAHFANQNSVDHPETDLLVNGQGTIKVLERSVKTKVGRVVFASSGCSVYGSKAPLPLKEDYISLHLDTPYMITKMLGELYCNFYYNFYKLPVAIARYFNVYGPGEIPGAYRNVIPNFMYLALNGKPLNITGTGEETRDYTFVEDIVDGTLRLGVLPEAVGDAFNLASEREIKTIEMANMVLEVTGSKAGITYQPLRNWDNIIKRRASIEKAHRVLGYEPKMKFDEGVRRVYEWITSNWDKIQASARF